MTDITADQLRRINTKLANSLEEVMRERDLLQADNAELLAILDARKPKIARTDGENDIPAYDLRIITAGARDKDEVSRLRFTYVYGFEAGRSAAVSAIHGVRAPRANAETILEEDDA